MAKEDNMRKCKIRIRFVGVFLVLASLATSPIVQAEYVRLDASMAQPVVLIGDSQKAYLRVSLSGLELPKTVRRTPVNVVIVLDKSGSMQGSKIADAKAAAIKAIGMLGPDDIVSVVAYDDTVTVLVPATKVADRQQIFTRIERIQAGGQTALFAGVSKGAAEARKFFDRSRVNRVILLSDGLANVGPSSAGDLAELGTSLGHEGISVTTIGLGLDYNEDLMSQLAQNSDGNHMFAERPSDLDRIFAREFGDVLSVVAQDVEIIIECAEGIRPIRILGRDGDVVGRRVVTSINQLYSQQDKYVLLEVELPETRGKSNNYRMHVADVHCSFDDTLARQRSESRARVSVRLSSSADLVEKNRNATIMGSVIEQIGVERNKFAVQLRDEGRIREAKKVLEENAQMLQEAGAKYDDDKLRAYSKKNKEAEEQIENDEDWRRQRKLMREEQHNIVNQQFVTDN